MEKGVDFPKHVMWVDPLLKKSLSTKEKGFSYVDNLNWARTFSTISMVSSFASFAGDSTYLGDKPKVTKDSDDTPEACFPNNLVWFLVIGPLIPAVTSKMFSTLM